MNTLSSRPMGPRGRLTSKRGQALAEFMIVLPVLVLLIFGLIEMGAAWRTFQVATNTAREGARLTVLPSAVEADVRTEMDARLRQGGLDPANATFAFNCTNPCFGSGRVTGEGAEVRVSYPFQFVFLGPIVNYIGGNGGAWGTITMETGFVMRIE
jgi:Flp pilus assembly protein TadG